MLAAPLARLPLPALGAHLGVRCAALLAHAAPPPPARPRAALDDFAPATRPRVVLAVLLALYVSNQWARMLPSYLVSFDVVRLAQASAAYELMNADLNFDQAQYGLLVSYGFSLLYTAFALPAGAACDRYSRKKILIGSAVGWALATAGSALAQNFNHILISRILLSISQAFATPAAVSLIASLFPSGERATATSIYSAGIYMGGALASLSVVLSRLLGWRQTALVTAASCAPATIVLALVLHEQKRTDAAPLPSQSPHRATELSSTASLTERLNTVLAVPSVRLLLAASAARFFAGFAIGAWTAPFYRTYFGMRADWFAVLNACIVSGAGSLSVITGGWLSDLLVRRGEPHRVSLVPSIGSLLAIPCWVVAMQVPHFYVSMLGLCGAYLCAECWYGVTISMMQAALPTAVRGTAQGLLNMVQILGNASPFLMGHLLTRGVALRPLATIVTPAAYVICAIFFWLAGRARRYELLEEKQTRQA